MTPLQLLGKILGLTTPTVLEQDTLRAMEKAWSKSTWDSRCGLWTRFETWSAGQPMTPFRAVTFLRQQTCEVQAKLPYAKAFCALFSHMASNTAPLKLYEKSLVAQGALVPIQQAKAMTKPQVLRLAARILNKYKAKGRGAAITTKAAWKVAGRWTETAEITREMCPVLTPTRIVVAWGQKHKSGRLKPYSKSMYTVIQGDWTAEICAYIKTLKANQPLTTWTTRKISLVMRTLFGQGYSSHSIKHGAVTFLMRLVAQGIITLEEAARLAKHANVETTLRYAGDPEATALALGTQRATALL